MANLSKRILDIALSKAGEYLHHLQSSQNVKLSSPHSGGNTDCHGVKPR